jgi:PAS domain-containing protein
MARRFPRVGLAFPYSVAMYIVPMVADETSWGAILMIWPGSRPELSAVERARVGATADRMAVVLRDAAALGGPVRPGDEPVIIEPAAGHTEPAVAFADRLPEGLVALDRHGRMTLVTDKAARLLGRDRAELLGAELWDALPWLDDPAYENAFVAALFSWQPAGFDARRPDDVWLSFLLYPDAGGVTVRVTRTDGAGSGEGTAENTMPSTPARAGTLFHLLHLAAALTEAAGVNEVTESIMEQMRPVLGAEGLALLSADEGRLRVLGSIGFPPHWATYFDDLPLAARTEGTRTIETGVAGFHSTNAELVHTYPQHHFYREMPAFAYLPLTVSSGTFGCLMLGYDVPRTFSPDERAELTSLAGIIAQALERARLYDTNVQTARGLQVGLLPRHLPQVPGLEVAARYRPATRTLDVGGDFYDLIDFGEHAAGAVIGDVQGHGVQAAALMGQIRTTVHSFARMGVAPDEILARTNRLLLELNVPLFCSCQYVHIDVPGQRAFLSSAGHLPPILRHSSHRTEVLDLPPGLLLGIDEEAHFQTVEVPFPQGAVLALYTDGLVERPGIDVGNSIDLLAAQLATSGGESMDAVADAIVQKAQETQTSDDIALMLVRHT